MYIEAAVLVVFSDERSPVVRVVATRCDAGDLRHQRVSEVHQGVQHRDGDAAV